MKLPYTQLNPLPVMGKDAFAAFAKEWRDYLKSQGEDYLRGQIVLPSPAQFRKYFGHPGCKGSISCASAEVAEIVGTCGNPFETKNYSPELTQYYFRSDRSNSPKDTPNEIVFSIDSLADFELSDIAFINLRVPNSTDSEILKDILNKTRKMIYERSALVHRGLLGGYYL